MCVYIFSIVGCSPVRRCGPFRRRAPAGQRSCVRAAPWYRQSSPRGRRSAAPFRLKKRNTRRLKKGK